MPYDFIDKNLHPVECAKLCSISVVILFQVSLSSVLQAKGDKFQTDETQVSFGTDLDASNLTESRFIEGLEKSLDKLLTSNTIVDDEDNEN